jgi:hypothetical protein
VQQLVGTVRSGFAVQAFIAQQLQQAGVQPTRHAWYACTSPAPR